MADVCLFSGGLDSTVLLYHLVFKRKTYPIPLLVNYEQRHGIELMYAQKMCQHLELWFETADLSGITNLLKGSSQSDPNIPVPEGHYEEESMKATVVPNRNMIMIACAAAFCQSIGGGTVYYAAHAGDHAIYPDCRPEFVYAMRAAVRLSGWVNTALEAPFIKLTKTQIVIEGSKLGVPFEKTWSCYKGFETHCGVCGTCVERKEAFTKAGITDPTTYAQ